MMVRKSLLAVPVLLLLGAVAAAAELPLSAAHGVVDKVGKDTLTIRPRGADGKFEKNVTLRVTGTSKVSTVSARTQAGKVVVTQRDTELKDLKPKQPVAVLYTTVKGGPVLLSAVVESGGGK
jgi:hypothetical protein